MPDLLLKVGSIALLLGGLIFVHELGHFVVAKALGVKVVRFSIGFGPRLFGFRRGETEYRISLLPLGGYVKMAGDDPSEELAPEDRGRGFLEQPPWKRLVIAFAGPAANLVFPGIIYFALMIGQNGEPTAGPVVGTVAPGSPAAEAGLRAGDRIVAVQAPGAAAAPVRYFGDLRDLVSPHPGEPLSFRVERDGATLEPLTIVPAAEVESNPLETIRRGVIGVTPFYAPAVVAPARPGAAGALEPFDLVVSVNGEKVRHLGDLEHAVRGASCQPVALEVVREKPVSLPGATLATFDPMKLEQVPTCVDGGPAFLSADPSLSTFVAAVVPGSPADKAGLRRGDAIAAINGKRVRSFTRDVNALGREFQAGKPVQLELADGRKTTLVPAKESYVDELTKERAERLLLGFHPDRRAVVDPRALVVAEVPLQRGAVEMAELAWRQLSEVVRLTMLGIQRIVTGQISFKTVGGPIMLFSIASEAAEEGWASFLFKMALISVNLGLMNLLPIPVLDGGHIAQALVEGITRRPLSLRAREIANIVGIILLFTLMIFVFKNDIVRLMG
ncbi:RIP metalloprotease RseP [Anaeromyxobacter sp. Fw109-5]|uniref:RIP metalloprotease RseP n=1 Tax=Anaeromyxobacter sp. (strain Fw109-5) TaxID=404589 RepID=UPI0000ED6FB6|nr:RIP metalloprotease RseP [Anaeromyxobacter sp. Fw109-5]ABS27882.1 putative membrane-associated zinc metalloprotease [Anaeromyxobacter sp. Fw109-5]